MIGINPPVGEADETVMEPQEDGSMVVTFKQASPEDEDAELGAYALHTPHTANLVDVISEEEKYRIALLVMTGVQQDLNDRSERIRMMELGLDLLGVKVEERNEPFQGACSAHHPLLLESAVKFQSKASNELLPGNGPVKTKILGDVTVEKEQKAARVKAHMNYQVTELMTEFYSDTERLLLHLAIFGSGFKKVFYDALLDRPVSEFVTDEQLVVPNNAPDLHRAPRITHILEKTSNQMEQHFATGFYREPDSGLFLGGQGQQDGKIIQNRASQDQGIDISFDPQLGSHTLYEQYIDLVIDGIDQHTGYDKDYSLSSPYIATVDRDSQQLIGLRRNWKEGDERRKKQIPFVHFQFVPSFNFYGFGFLHLLGNIQLTLTSSLRSLVDAGQFANLQGGFKLKGVRMTDDGGPIAPGQFKEIECAVQDINKALMPLPYKEPSQVLMQMLQFLDSKGQGFANQDDQIVSNATNYGPVGTTMALLEASAKFFSATHKRLHASMKVEFGIIADINAETLDDELEYNLENETMKVSRLDYGPHVSVVPVSDPNISSSAHRLAKAQTLLEIALRAPEQHNIREVLKHVYANMEYPNIDKILPAPEEAQMLDPMSDIIAAQQGKPIKAFQGQDHKSHIAIKQAFLADPMSGASPIMQKAAAQIQANIQEHMIQMFIEQTQAQSQLNGGDITVAAQQIAVQNQQLIQQQVQEQQMGTKEKAALLLAQAEMLDSQTQHRKQQFSELHSTAKLALDAKKLHLAEAKAVQDGLLTKETLDHQVKMKGIEATISAMQDTYAAKQQKQQHMRDLAHQKEMGKGLTPTKKDT